MESVPMFENVNGSSVRERKKTNDDNGSVVLEEDKE